MKEQVLTIRSLVMLVSVFHSTFLWKLIFPENTDFNIYMTNKIEIIFSIQYVFIEEVLMKAKIPVVMA